MATRRSVLAGLAAGGLALAAPPARAEPGWSASRPLPRPVARPSRLIRAAGLADHTSYVAIEPGSGRLIEGRDADRAVPPASTLKIVTALFALDRIAKDHRFATRVLRDGDRLILAGGGDPLLDTDGLADLAAAAAADPAGASAPPRRLAVWGGALPHVAELSPPQADHLAYNPTISGMVLNFNRVHLGWREGGAAVAVEARAERHSPRAYTVRVDPRSGGPIFDWREEQGLEIWSANRAALARAGSRWLPVRRPEAYAGDVFQTLMRKMGVALAAPEIIDDLPSGAVEIARIDSPPLREIVAGMLRYSTNLTAEVLGLHASGASDLTSSAAAMRDWLHRAGIRDIDPHDHSGLSPDSRITARALARTIAELGPRHDLRGVLPQIAAPDPAADTAGAARLLAKTGTLNFVSNLAGVAGDEHRDIVFAVLVADGARRAQTEGSELPRGVVSWTARAKALQGALAASLLHKAGEAGTAARG